jgi:hypothetical protein
MSEVKVELRLNVYFLVCALAVINVNEGCILLIYVNVFEVASDLVIENYFLALKAQPVNYLLQTVQLIMVFSCLFLFLLRSSQRL